MLLVPLPYLMVVEGSVPVVRFAFLALVASAYSGFVDGSGVAWVMTAVLAGHALVYAALLWLPCAALARWLPARRRGVWVVALLALGFAGALLGRPYRTPFDDAVLRSGWLGLFQ